MILPDARGHGASGRGQGETSIERLAQDVVEVMDALGVDSAGFAGCSMGGAVGMYLAASCPDRFAWFVFANAPARIALPRETFETGINAARTGGYGALVRGMMSALDNAGNCGAPA